MNRQQAADAMAQHFAPQLALLVQLTNYASNLIPRAYNSSGKQLLDIVVCYSLLKQFAMMLDAVEVLARSGATQAAHLQARSAFEISLFIEWMLVADGQRKAMHYYVGNVRNERLWATRATEGTEASNKFLQTLGELGADIGAARPSMDDEAKRLIKAADRILANHEFAEANEGFERHIRDRKLPFEPPWYAVLGMRSVRAIAEALQRLPEYVIFYQTGSEVVHSSSYTEHLRFTAAGADVTPIRTLQHTPAVLNAIMCNSLLVFRRVLGYYRPAELTDFSERYLAEWRDAFRNIPKIEMAVAK